MTLLLPYWEQRHVIHFSPAFKKNKPAIFYFPYCYSIFSIWYLEKPWHLLFGVLNNSWLPKEQGSSKTRFSCLLPFFGDGFNLLRITCKVLWEEMSTSGPIPCCCCWGMRDVWGSCWISALLGSLKSPVEAQGSCPGAIPLPTKPDPVPPVSLQGGQGRLLAKTVFSSLFPLRAVRKVCTGGVIFDSTHF